MEPLLAWGQSDAAALLAGVLGEPVAVEHTCPACGSGAHGRPWVRLRDGRRPDVSVAHVGDLTLVGVSWNGRVGVDLEAADAVAPPGFASLADWVRYEAHGKATGEGLRRPISAGFEPAAMLGTVEIPGCVAAWCVLPR